MFVLEVIVLHFIFCLEEILFVKFFLIIFWISVKLRQLFLFTAAFAFYLFHELSLYLEIDIMCFQSMHYQFVAFGTTLFSQFGHVTYVLLSVFREYTAYFFSAIPKLKQR